MGLLYYYMSPFPLAQLLIAFSIGVILSPFSGALIFILGFALIVDIYVFHSDNDNYDILLRIGIILAYIFGWIIGKSVTGIDIPFMSSHMDNKHF